jgi:signal transduction histidine kinase/CheY-like chemotaxis protein
MRIDRTEWENLDHDRFLVLLGALLLFATLLVVNNHLLSTYFHHSQLVGKQPATLGLLLVGASAAAYPLLGRSVTLATVVFIGGVCVVIGLALAWGIDPGARPTTMLPVLLAILLLAPVQSLLLVSGWLVWLVAANRLGIGLPAAETVVVAAVAILCWLTYLLVRSMHIATLRSYEHYFRHARDRLEEARDDRLKLNQTNADLANALLQLERLNRMLHASQLATELAKRAKEEFVANVSHELRTPLNMIIGFTEMIIQSPTYYGSHIPPALLADVRVIHRNCQHLAQLINDVLALSQVEAGQMTLSRAWVAVEEIVQEAVQAVEPLFRAKGLSLEVSLPAELRPVFCDRLRIRQVLLNLLSNAGRYTTAGGVTVAVTAGAERVIFAVSDTGPGIPPDERERIFEPFVQLGTPSGGQQHGSGLGLSVNRQLVRLHDGEMWLESTLGQGTSFFFSLPYNSYDLRISARADRWINPDYVERERRPLPPLPKPKDWLLVFERQPTLAEPMRRVLNQVEIVTVEREDQLEAEVATHQPVALFINDAGAMSDRRFISRFSSLPARLPVISCYAPGKQEALEQLKVVDYLIKPVARQELLAAVAHVARPASSILLVEDDLELALLFRRQIESMGCGYRIIQAVDGAAALRTMRTRRLDLVLLDLGLPDSDGYQVLQEKNGDPQLARIPVIVVSARDPLGNPIVTGRLRVELVGGLSTRDIARCTAAISHAFSATAGSAHPMQPATSAG